MKGFLEVKTRVTISHSKAVEWLLELSKAIRLRMLSSLDPSFSDVISHNHRHSHHQQVSEEKKSTEQSTDLDDQTYRQQNSNNNVLKSPACSSD
ncbi:hypothetical protein OSB04_022166 [Centaurea solstitialis]|uniref:Uncharacterized protein n=1 Tax=Centaurea solstitialis TaxID=347529 RepID=A0AA38TFF3_9ASTR|nr:hypothetical protein OSB04_022166 [Centaurea solstitialis]